MQIPVQVGQSNVQINTLEDSGKWAVRASIKHTRTGQCEVVDAVISAGNTFDSKEKADEFSGLFAKDDIDGKHGDLLLDETESDQD